MKKEYKEQLRQVKDELDNISVVSEYIENYNKLICDKLEEIRNLDPTKEDILIQIVQLTRYSECYITLNYSITQQLNKINDSVIKINDLLEACNNED